jgi:DHA1 family multidrug resistance protein-like MFS transporter
VPAWRPPRLRSKPLEPWRRSQYLVVLTVGLAHIAFDLTQPFIPLYVRTLGAGELSDAALWSGLIIGISPLCGAVMGPLWGTLADRFGRKPMVLRAMVMIGLLQLAQAAVPNVQWLLVTRIVMGLFAGFTPMAMALAVSLGPREQIGRVIGLIQAAQFLPIAIGPPIGGLISDAFGLRANFVITSVLLIVPTALLFFLVDEGSYGARSEHPRGRPAGGRGASLGLLLVPGFAAAMAILFLTRFTDRTLPPILPLYLVEIETPETQLATLTGLIVASGAVAAAISSLLLGRLARPGTTRRVLILALAGGALCSAPLALTTTWQQVLGLRVLLGLFAGGTMGLAYTLGARLAPPERAGLAMTVLSSGGQLGGAISPMLMGLLGQASLRAVFLASAGVYLLGVVLAALLAGPSDRITRAQRSAS